MSNNPRKRNSIAADLRTAKYKKRVVNSKLTYSRKKEKEIVRKELQRSSDD